MKLIKIILSIFLLVGCQPKKEEPQETKEVTPDTVSFVAVGDNIMHQRMLDCAKQNNTYDFSPYYDNIKPFIQSYDLAFVNQETILGGESSGYSGYPNFNTPDIMAKNLSDVGFNIVNGATNHCLDMKEAGVKHSIEVFKQYPSIHYIGLYNNEEEKENIPIITQNNITFALLSYNQYINNNENPPSYIYQSFDKKKIKEDVEKAKQMSDIIIVSCHWGKEYSQEATAFQKEYAQYLTDLGVDVIIGTHSHTLQNIEYLTNKEGHQTLVAYSLGNFVNGMLEEDSQLGGMLSMNFVKENNKTTLQNVTLTPLINHYYTKNIKNIMGTRYGFTIYRLKDYNEQLASQHGLNHYNNITINYEDMKEKVNQLQIKDIQINM